MKSNEVENKAVIYEMSVEDVMHNSMMPYSEYVILDRALPRVEDGLKPVQRRILYSMHELGLSPDKPHKKSARIVGECLGKYHPHGDTSVYDAMVRMAQPFNMRMPLVDGHGNFGSIDGDRAAAMRYTEARLGSLAEFLLGDLEKDTVSWQLNFDDTLKEPTLLPSRFPNLLVNGANGIAVGFSTNIPPHNIVEVIDGTIALIDSPRMSLNDLMKIIKGPDFPSGGIIIAGKDLETAYETGRGRVIMRARLHIEDADYDKKNIVITELPYQVEKSDLLQKILALRENKKDILGGISDIVDESDRNGMRAVITVKKDADVNQIIRYLFRHTRLELNFNFNMVAIADGKPKQLGLVEILKYYIEFQRDVLVKRCNFELKSARIRAEIVEGLIVAINNIDEVIKIIKQSKNATIASENLRARFNLSERQAQAILEMKLRRLTGLDFDTLQKELEELLAKIDELTQLVNSKRLQSSKMKAELNEVKRRFKDDRRSAIQAEGEVEEIPYENDETAYKEGIMVLNSNGTLKFVTTRGFAQSQRRAADCTEDTIVKKAIYCNNRQNFIAFSNLGNCYKLSVDDIPEKRWREKGTNIASLSKDAEPKEQIISIVITDGFPIGEALFFTSTGHIKRTQWNDLDISKTCYKVMNLKDDEQVINVESVVEGSNIFMATKGGMSLLFELSEVPTQGRNAGGVRGIMLNDGDSVIFAGQITEEGEILVVSNHSFAKRVFAFSFDISKRYRKGLKIIDMPNNHELSLVDYVCEPYDMVITNTKGEVFGYSTEDIKLDARTTKGKQLLKKGGIFKAESHIVDYFKPLNA